MSVVHRILCLGILSGESMGIDFPHLLILVWLNLRLGGFLEKERVMLNCVDSRGMSVLLVVGDDQEILLWGLAGSHCEPLL